MKKTPTELLKGDTWTETGITVEFTGKIIRKDLKNGKENYLVQVIQKALNYKIYPRTHKPSPNPYYYEKKATTKINVRNR